MLFCSRCTFNRYKSNKAVIYRRLRPRCCHTDMQRHTQTRLSQYFAFLSGVDNKWSENFDERNATSQNAPFFV